MLIGLHVPEIQPFQILTLKIQRQDHGCGQSHNMSLTSYWLTSLWFHVNRHTHSCSIFKIWPWKSKVKVIAQGHKVGITPYRLVSLSFHVGPPVPGIQLFQNFTLKIQGQGHGWGQGWKSQHGSNIQTTQMPFCSMSIGHPITELQLFQNLTKGQGQMTTMLYNYRSRWFHRTLNGINPSSGFRDMGSAKSGPSAAWFDKFLAHGQAHVGQMGK